VDGIGGFKLRLKKEPSLTEIIKALEDSINLRIWDEIVFCGFGEPTERLDCLIQVSKWIKRYFAYPIRLDTNGQAYLLYPEIDVVEELKKAGVTKISVSLNAHSKETYLKVCRPTLKNVYSYILEFIRDSANILETEVTAVDLPEVNLHKVKEIAERLGATFRKRSYYFPAI